MVIARPAATPARAELRHEGGGLGPHPRPVAVEVGIDRIVEVGVPFDLLGVKVDPVLLGIRREGRVGAVHQVLHLRFHRGFAQSQSF